MAELVMLDSVVLPGPGVRPRPALCTRTGAQRPASMVDRRPVARVEAAHEAE